MKSSLIALIALTLFLNAYGQNRNNVWAFGRFAGLDFNTGVPVPITTAISNNGILTPAQPEGVASVCDSNGQLLFYCIGDKIWRKNHQVMPGANPLINYKTGSTTQGALIVPVINNPTQYYVFSIQEQSDYFVADNKFCRLFYSIVDMKLNNGLGDVVPGRKGILLDSNLSEKMIAVPGANRNIWLLVHGLSNTIFKAFEITCNGINTIPVISDNGNFSGYRAYSSGVMKYSPDHNKLVVCNKETFLWPGPNDQRLSMDVNNVGTELYDFDAGTGTVSNGTILESGLYDYGACFSPDNLKLYICRSDRNTSSIVDQYDLNQPNIAAVRSSKVNVRTSDWWPSDIKAGPDGKLYLNSLDRDQYNDNHMDCINFPDRPGTACGYVSKAINLGPGRQKSIGLPNEIVEVPAALFQTFSRHDTIVCSANSIVLKAPAGYDTCLWDNLITNTERTVSASGVYYVVSSSACGVHTDTFYVNMPRLAFSLPADTTFCDSATMLLKVPAITGATYRWQDGSDKDSFLVTSSGSYYVTINQDGCTAADTINIRMINLNQASWHSWEDTFRICENEAIDLDANIPAGTSILWSNGCTTSKNTVTVAGQYWETVTNAYCSSSDTAYVAVDICDCELYLPNVFSPNGDGKNDLFRPVARNGCVIQSYEMKIYNRWGQLVFHGSESTQVWDGTFNGIPQELGTYMYSVTYSSGTKKKRHVMKGDLILVR